MSDYTKSDFSVTEKVEVSRKNATVKVPKNLGDLDTELTSIETAIGTKVDEVSSTDNAIARFDGTSGALQNSAITIDDSGYISSTNFLTTSYGGAIRTTGQAANLILYRPEAHGNTIISQLTFSGFDSGPAYQQYASIQCNVSDNTAGSEDAELYLKTSVAGTESARATIGQGVQVGSPTGGDKGAGTLNATGLYVNGTAVSTGGKVAQVVSTETGAFSSGTTTIPLDDTIPQNTEGNEFMTLAITPTNASSTLIIEAYCNLAHSSNSRITPVIALFQDSTASALAASWGTSKPGVANAACPGHLRHVMTAGTTSSTTFKIRAGTSASGTMYFNGTAGSRYYGGTMSSHIVITEVLP